MTTKGLSDIYHIADKSNNYIRAMKIAGDVGVTVGVSETNDAHITVMSKERAELLGAWLAEPLIIEMMRRAMVYQRRYTGYDPEQEAAACKNLLDAVLEQRRTKIDSEMQRFSEPEQMDYSSMPGWGTL